jgi:hypothetical protein
MLPIDHEITQDASIGEVVVAATATPTASPRSTARPTTRPGASTEPSQAPQTSAAPSFGQPLIIYGYGPANAAVKLNGIGVSGQVISDHKGYFRFTSIYSLTALYPEICLYGIDIDNKVTMPTCIPPIPPEREVPLEVGPVLLSPTISLSNNNVTAGQDVYLSGYAVPNSNVTIFMQRDKRRSFKLVNEAFAYGLPGYDVQTDDNGYYEAVLPSSHESSYKIYSAGKMGDTVTAKSNTLNFNIISKVVSFWQLLAKLLFNSIMSVIILLQVIVVVILSYLLSKSPRKPYKHIKYSSSDVRQKYLEFLKSKQAL